MKPLSLNLPAQLNPTQRNPRDPQPAMDAPYAAVSIKEFWGRRYNQIVSATLQVGILHD